MTFIINFWLNSAMLYVIQTHHGRLSQLIIQMTAESVMAQMTQALHGYLLQYCLCRHYDIFGNYLNSCLLCCVSY